MLLTLRYTPKYFGQVFYQNYCYAHILRVNINLTLLEFLSIDFAATGQTQVEISRYWPYLKYDQGFKCIKYVIG